MKTTLKAVSLGMVLAAASVSSIAYANCPSGLTAEERVSCIHMEGAGLAYQDFLVERAEIIESAQAARASHDIAAKRQDVKSKSDSDGGKLSTSLSM